MLHIYRCCSHAINVEYDTRLKKIYLIDCSSGFKMSIPFKKCNDSAELKEYAEGYIDMLLRMGGKE